MKYLLILFFIFQSQMVLANSYNCKVTRKVGPESTASENELKKWQFSVKIHDSTKPELERCSLVTSHNRITCDKYIVDKVEFDKFVGIKKFYYFKGQFDVQLYPDMSFIENNGRGSISFGKCNKQ